MDYFNGHESHFGGSANEQYAADALQFSQSKFNVVLLLLAEYITQYVGNGVVWPSITGVNQAGTIHTI